MRVALKGRPTLDLTRALHIDLNQRRYVISGSAGQTARDQRSAAVLSVTVAVIAEANLTFLSEIIGRQSQKIIRCVQETSHGSSVSHCRALAQRAAALPAVVPNIDILNPRYGASGEGSSQREGAPCSAKSVYVGTALWRRRLKKS